MNIEDAILNRVATDGPLAAAFLPAAGGGAFIDTAPPNTPFPYVRIHATANPAELAGGGSYLEMTQIDVAIFTTSESQAQSLAELWGSRFDAVGQEPTFTDGSGRCLALTPRVKPRVLIDPDRGPQGQIIWMASIIYEAISQR